MKKEGGRMKDEGGGRRDEGGRWKDEGGGRMEAVGGGGGVRDLRGRTKDFALRIIRLYVALPKTTEAQVIGKQMLRSGTSVGAHYREGCRARSDAEFISKLEGGLQELEETGYWMELLVEAGITPKVRLAPLMNEADQLTAILVSCTKKAKNRI